MSFNKGTNIISIDNGNIRLMLGIKAFWNMLLQEFPFPSPPPYNYIFLVQHKLPENKSLLMSLYTGIIYRKIFFNLASMQFNIFFFRMMVVQRLRILEILMTLK